MIEKISYSIFGRYTKKNKNRYHDLRKSLRMARIPIYYDTYVATVMLLSLGIGISSGSLAFLAYRYNLVYFSVFDAIPSPIIFFLIFLVGGYLTHTLLILYPRFVANTRKTKIDLMLPHAVSFMYAMSRGGMPIYDVFKSLAENLDIYDEVAREASMVIRDVDYLGCDIITAMHNTAQSTPSKSFKDFIENLITMVSSGGDVARYLEAKSRQCFETAKKEQEMFLNTLELIGEAYVVAFVAGPIFILIALTTMGMLGSSDTSHMFYGLYLALPVGSISMILLLDAILPKEDIGTTYTTKKELKRFTSVELADEEEDYYEKLKQFKRFKRFDGIISLLKNPFVPFYEYPMRTLYISIPSVLIFIAWASISSVDVETLLVSIALILMVPLSLIYELKTRWIRKIDKAIPDFLNNLASINEVGLTLRAAIEMLLKSDFGVLSSEIKMIWRDLEWGGEVKDALFRFENRIKTVGIRRAITLMTKANEISDNIRDILVIAANDAENSLSMRRERFNNTFVYITTIYISFVVFLYAAYTLSMTFMPSLSSEAITGFDFSSNTRMMFHTSLMLGFFSGLIAGQMGEGDLMYGLKHSIAFLVVSYLLFTFVII